MLKEGCYWALVEPCSWAQGCCGPWHRCAPEGKGESILAKVSAMLLWVYLALDNSSSRSLQMWIHGAASAPFGTERHLGKLTLAMCDVTGNSGEEKGNRSWGQLHIWVPQLVSIAKMPKVPMTLENMSDFIIIMQMFFWEGMYLLVFFRLTCFIADGSELYCSGQSKQVYLTAEEEKSTKRKTQLIHSQWYSSIWTKELCAEHSATSLLKRIVCW